MDPKLYRAAGTWNKVRTDLNVTLTSQDLTTKTYGLPKLTAMPLTMRQVTPSWLLTTVREDGGITKVANFRVINYDTRNNVGLAGEWKYHLPKGAQKTTIDQNG